MAQVRVTATYFMSTVVCFKVFLDSTPVQKCPMFFVGCTFAKFCLFFSLQLYSWSSEEKNVQSHRLSRPLSQVQSLTELFYINPKNK